MKIAANTTPKAAATKAAAAKTPKAATKAAAPATPATPVKAAPAAKQPKDKRMTIVPEGNRWTFEPKAITLDGLTFPATYSVKPQSGDVFVFAAMQGIALRLHIATGHPLYHGAFDAAMAAKAAKPAAKAEPAAKQPSVKAPAADKAKAKASLAKGKAEREAAKAAPAAKQPKAKAAAPAKPATPAKAAKQPAAKAAPKAAAPAAKQPTGEITGKGWRIVFDDAEQRTRVCFTGKPSAKQKAAVEAAGFFWSQRLQSWNKKLTHKAARAAQALAVQLAALK